MTSFIRQIADKLLRNFRGPELPDSDAVENKIFALIHTPKCGGTYLKQNYQIDGRDNISDIGHSNIRARRIQDDAIIIGLIREPLDWYASYYYFCKKSLAEAPQGEKNFPANHPISILSDNATIPFEEMINNMSDRQLLRANCESVCNIYATNKKDIFDFMLRTGCGFWTWTMIHHFSRKPTSKLHSSKDVANACRDIRREVTFIHLEDIDEDVGRYLGIKPKAGKSVNRSNRPGGLQWNPAIVEVVNKLDGGAAKLLGGY